ncbi:protease inhibitor I9 family protein [Paenibacillus tyrfis]|uniref:protease inhibitor I9 family protein n=1 Tax=Paenibacillus tyrfis TaxID=1501230 RepID=UPI00209D4FD7|nr:protease inhibitor I9 family protein [Paenibacillus tyrfis]MCP1308055.1 protease inhibitor I9 family protein [Paenibacillus tyrfis]
MKVNKHGFMNASSYKNMRSERLPAAWNRKKRDEVQFSKEAMKFAEKKQTMKNDHTNNVKDEVKIMPIDKTIKDKISNQLSDILNKEPANQKYPCIVVLDESLDKKTYEEISKKFGVLNPKFQYDGEFKGLAVDLTKQQIHRMKELDFVKFIELDNVATTQ